MRYINTSDTNITFTDTNGKVMVVPKNRVYTHFNVDTVTFLLIERYDNEGICIFTTIAEDLEINGTTYTYEQLLDGEGISDLFSPTGSLSYKIVDELPQTGTNGVIYLVPKGENSHTEYLWIEDEERYEMLGDVGDIDLTDYYTKTQVDEKLALKADASNVYTKSEADGKFLTEHQSLANYPTIETMNTALGQKANVSDIYTQTEIDNKLAAKADASNVYTKAEVDTQSETTAQALSNINTQLAAKANSADLATVATSGSYNDLSDKPVIPEGAVVDAALSDTSEHPVQNKVVKAAIDEAKAYYINFTALSQQGITDADWDGMVAAINAHRPIYAGLYNRYYTGECLYQDGSNIIRMTASDELNHYFYMFTKRGTNDYTMTYEVRPYVTEVEKHNWSAKQDALISGRNIKTVNNQSILGEGNIEIQGGGGGMDEDTELLISSALVDLNDRKIDATEVKENYQKKGDYATNAKVDTKANISDVPTNTDYEEAQKITSWSLNDLNARLAELEARVAQLES